ncbi:hypothetical protein RGU70_03745 [Herbaspirillum sp. RTI4]|uniref:hypothetical protein n=1 Tax=Herbaspirillum sp. RTI4 TaxID=3048640 RepID=UPI002AB34F34|nr:hypothetical protein [Herbaspirillum sp. RTI4]MDY7577431.1 hypothetical protein [Herbaspirillum sp. RTI4]MEA9981707.1 hypothetical protein [Herbaspirillum sp. RTI4]
MASCFSSPHVSAASFSCGVIRANGKPWAAAANRKSPLYGNVVDDVALCAEQARSGSRPDLELLINQTLRNDSKGAAAEQALFFLYLDASPDVRGMLGKMAVDLYQMKMAAERDLSPANYRASLLGSALSLNQAGHLLYIVREAAQGCPGITEMIDPLFVESEKEDLRQIVDSNPAVFWNRTRFIDGDEINTFAALRSNPRLECLPCVSLDSTSASEEIQQLANSSSKLLLVPFLRAEHWQLMVIEPNPEGGRPMSALFNSNLAENEQTLPVAERIKDWFAWTDVRHHVREAMQATTPDGCGLFVSYMIEQLMEQYRPGMSILDIMQTAKLQLLLRLQQEPDAFGREMRLQLIEPFLVRPENQRLFNPLDADGQAPGG